MGGPYPYMDLNAKYEKLLLQCFTTIDPNKDISKNEASARVIAKFSDGYKSTMD